MLTKKAKIIIIIAAIMTVCLLTLPDFIVLTPRFNGSRTITINRGAGLEDVADSLQREETINSPLLFNLYAIVTNNAKKIKAGQYEFNGLETIPEIVKIVVSGRVTEKEITIIEGWNLADIGEYLENRNINSAEDFFRLAGKPLYLNKSAIQNNCRELIGVGAYDLSDKYSFLINKPASVNLEGYLYPDTYRLPFDADIEAAIKIMLDNFDKKLTLNLRSEINRQNKKISEIIKGKHISRKELQKRYDLS